MTAPGTNDEILRVENLSCGYGSGDVLQDVSLRFHRGEMVGITGPNGAGKTTLFRAMSGGLPPSRGTVYLAGKPLAETSPVEAARRMALTPQVLDVPFSFRVEEFVGMGRLPHMGRFSSPGREDREAVLRAMALVDLVAFAQRPLNTLSGGERQRAVIAQALAQEPELLLLDEPGAFLDVNHQVEAFELLLKIRSEGTAVLVVLHDLNLASEYCERIVMLQGGKVRADGPPEEVITSDLLASAFGIRLEVTSDPVTGKPSVRYRRAPAPDPLVKGVRVHVVCGGGSGASLLRRLHLYGFLVSAGVLNEGDSDLAFARGLGLDAVVEAPFSPIGDSARRELEERIGEADILVICAVPFGHGNLGNLEAIPKALAGRTVMVEAEGDWDFTGGTARALLQDLRDGGALQVPSDLDALEAIRALAQKG